MRFTGAQVFDVDQGFVQRDVCTADGLLTTESGDEQVFDVSGLTLIPGLTDVHFHGAMGADFSDGDPTGLQAIADYELSRGVTQISPAGMTLSDEALIAMCQVAAEHRATATTGAELVGVHLEGPFLSMAKKGAQNGTWIQPPSVVLFNKLQAASGGLVKQVSLAPEYPDAMEFIRQVSDGTVVSLAHTSADYDTAMEAFQAGARQVTHLYNAMLPFAHRSPGVVGAAFDSKHCKVELICDGIHIHPAVVRATFQMFGADRMILVSDTMRAAGMPDGDYTLGGQAVKVKGREATLSDGTLAGSVTDLMDCMCNAVGMGIPLADAVKAAAVNPAKAIGIYDQVGSLEPGKLANFVLLDEHLALKAVVYRGKLVHGNI